MLKWITRSMLLILVLVILAIVGVVISARLAMDDSLAYTQAAQTLPEITQQAGSGLVQISTGGLTFRARVAGFDGQLDKPVVILLHGFPVNSAMWDALLPPLEAAGYRVVAFDQRGYSPSARPQQQNQYTIDKLTRDVIAIADTVGSDRFHLVGHDWGAAVGWSTVLTHPEQKIAGGQLIARSS